MDDQRIGALLRVLRIRRGLRQADVARLAGVSDQTISRIERGHLEWMSVGVLRRVARVLEARLDLGLWTRAGAVERMADAPHASLVEALIGELVRLGWIVRPEVSFNRNGERGLVDIVAWHAATRSLLLLEIKTALVDVGETVGTFDRKRRLAPILARQLGFDALTFSSALVLADTRTNHRRAQAHAATLRATLPVRGQRLRAFLRRPDGEVAALTFWPYRRPQSVRRPATGVQRVRRRADASRRARDARERAP